MKNSVKAFSAVIVAVMSITFSAAQFSPSDNTSLVKSKGYVPVNGLKMYYEIYGEGDPIVLLHGSYMTIDLNFGVMIPALAKTNRVIALEMQGHGRTSDISRPFSYASPADDVGGLMKHLNIDSANVLGYSLGGTVAFDLAIRHPELVKKLIIISSVFRYDGWIQSARDLFLGMDAEFLDHTPLKTEYDRLAPIKSDWKSFVNKMVAFDKISFDLGAANIKAIATPALLIMGDNDGVHLDHMAEMYRLFGGGVFGDMTGLPDSRLAILPATTHVSLMMETEKLLSIIQLFIQPARSRRPQHQK